MKIQVNILPDSNTVHLAGDLDLYNVEDVRGALLQHFRDKPSLALDLSGVETCDAAGFQLVLAIRLTAKALGRPFSILNPAPAIGKCGELVGAGATTWQSSAS